MTEFVRSVGSEPPTCLWVSVAVPVHVFSLSSGRPHSPQSLCQSSLIVSALSSLIQVFLSSADLVTAFRLVFRPPPLSLSFFLSLDWTPIKAGMAYLTLSLSRCLPPPFFFCCTYVHAMSIIRTFPSSSITPAASSTHGLERFPLCGLFIPPKVESTPVS